MKIYVIIHRAAGDVFNSYEGMSEESIAKMFAEIEPGATCDFLPPDEWAVKAEAADAKIKGAQNVQ